MIIFRHDHFFLFGVLFHPSSEYWIRAALRISILVQTGYRDKEMEEEYVPTQVIFLYFFFVFTLGYLQVLIHRYQVQVVIGILRKEIFSTYVYRYPGRIEVLFLRIHFRHISVELGFIFVPFDREQVSTLHVERTSEVHRLLTDVNRLRNFELQDLETFDS